MYEMYISIEVQSSKTMENGKWSWEETKQTPKNKTRKKRVRRYTLVHVTTSTYGEHSCSATAALIWNLATESITRYWTANHRSADTDNQSHVQLYSTFLCTIHKTFYL